MAQDVVVTEEDCGAKQYIIATEENFDGIVKSLEDNIFGRVLAKKVVDKDGNTLYRKKSYSKDDAKRIVSRGNRSSCSDTN